MNNYLKIDKFFGTIIIGDNMNILEVNRETLANLYEQYPENFKDLSLDGKDLVYNGERIDISNFNINDLLSDETMFLSSLSVLSSEDIFKIIRLHAITINSTLNKDKDNKSESEKKIEVIKKENPLLQNISVVKRSNGVGTDEYINIVDEMGIDHLFRNDRQVDFLQVYESLKLRNGGKDITPRDFIEEMNHKLYDVSLNDSRDLLGNSQTSEDFANKMRTTSSPYNDDNRIRVLGNESDDIAVVANDSNPEEHQVVTYRENEFGDMVVENHKQNVSGDMVVQGEQEVKETNTEVSDNKDETQVYENKEDKIEAVLISTEEFYAILNAGNDLDNETRRNVDLYYSYLGDLILYEDYLLPELKQILNQFKQYVFNLEYGDKEITINNLQQEAINKHMEMEEKKSLNTDELSYEKKEDKVKKLLLTKPDDTRYENAGSISTLQVIALVVGIAIILTAVTLYLIK